ncbi:TIGR02285 family protein [Herbaspirillum rubrisubalbicans]|uniref:ABC transporter substrate-binding protein n=2 Tax=Herbaspirillum TaxID=963 RepID=A0A6M3ZL71_9BURK|nr:TIGR02285 family protein [Herbaspirillum rubrisubalbicans]QJP99378.1 ABC transporter substrate-binding protein [Herbaspirillum rubrisubalbicans Os34]
MHSKLVRIPITALMLACLAPLALATEQIVWGKYNVPPYMIRSGEFAHQGIFDLTLDIIKKKLPQYQHVELEAPFPRINSEIVKGSHWCYNGMLKTPERENFGYLSLPISIFLPLRIIVRRDRLAQFKSPLSLQALLQNRQLTTSVMRDRSYSPTVDMLLADYRPQENYSEQVEAIGMLLAGRIDYMIELPLLAFEQARAMGQPDALVALPMQEANEVVFNRVMCPKNEWGRQVVEQVNKVLLEERAKPFYRAIVEKWHDPESVAQIRNIYDKVFLKIP